jgi:hypothetical protein
MVLTPHLVQPVFPQPRTQPIHGWEHADKAGRQRDRQQLWATQQDHPMKTAAELTREQLTDIVGRIQGLFYLDLDAAGNEVWDPDKPWDPDTLDDIAQTLAEYGLVPAGALPASGRSPEDALPEELERLLERLDEAGDDALLDELVHDLKGAEASAINNGGAQAQVEYLVSQLGAGEAARQIGEILADDAAAGDAQSER